VSGTEKAAEYTALLQAHRVVPTMVVAEECAGLPEHCSGLTRLDIGLNLPVPVNPLVVDTYGITAGLSFGGRRHTVVIPWSALAGVQFEPGEEARMYNAAAAQRCAAPTRTAPAPARVRHDIPKPSDLVTNVITVDFKARRRAQ